LNAFSSRLIDFRGQALKINSSVNLQHAGPVSKVLQKLAIHADHSAADDVSGRAFEWAYH
jgi:hypothetical protein